MMGIQLIGLFFCLFMAYMTFIYSKKGKFTSKEWLFWTSIWVFLLVLSLFPELLNPVLLELKLVRAMDFFISLGFMLFTGIIFYMYSVMRSNQKKIEVLNREFTFVEEKIRRL